MNLSLPRWRHESSHGRSVIRLGEGKVRLGKRGRGLLRRRCARLGKPEDMNLGSLVRLGEASLA